MSIKSQLKIIDKEIKILTMPSPSPSLIGKHVYNFSH